MIVKAYYVGFSSLVSKVPFWPSSISFLPILSIVLLNCVNNSWLIMHAICILNTIYIIFSILSKALENCYVSSFTILLRK